MTENINDDEPKSERDYIKELYQIAIDGNVDSLNRVINSEYSFGLSEIRLNDLIAHAAKSKNYGIVAALSSKSIINNLTESSSDLTETLYHSFPFSIEESLNKIENEQERVYVRSLLVAVRDGNEDFLNTLLEVYRRDGVTLDNESYRIFLEAATTIQERERKNIKNINPDEISATADFLKVDPEEYKKLVMSEEQKN